MIFAHLRSQDLLELWRYYQAAIINTIFGYGLFMLLIFFRMPLFVAQTSAFIGGAIFNYGVYSRHVFRTRHGAKRHFAAAYGVNYGSNLALLWLISHRIANPYLCGALASCLASLLNYWVLKRLVFLGSTP